MTEASSVLFFTVRKNKSYFSWAPLGASFNFSGVCIDAVSETEFAMYEGSCLKVYKFGRKLYASATRYRTLRNGIYMFAGQKDGRYIFRLARPL
jgi:hypothetical protein